MTIISHEQGGSDHEAQDKEESDEEEDMLKNAESFGADLGNKNNRVI